jgi:hypothetical protein
MWKAQQEAKKAAGAGTTPTATDSAKAATPSWKDKGAAAKAPSSSGGFAGGASKKAAGGRDDGGGAAAAAAAEAERAAAEAAAAEAERLRAAEEEAARLAAAAAAEEAGRARLAAEAAAAEAARLAYEEAYGARRYTLTPEHAVAFSRDGFVVVRGLLKANELRRLCAAVAQPGGLLAQGFDVEDSSETGRPSRCVNFQWPGNDALGRVARLKKVAGVVGDLLDGEVAHLATRVILREPHTAGGVWHQDCAWQPPTRARVGGLKLTPFAPPPSTPPPPPLPFPQTATTTSASRARTWPPCCCRLRARPRPYTLR